MTTKQGIAYIKNKNNKNKLIEANTQRRAAPTSELEKQAPVSYREIVDKNMQHVNDALVNCNNFCDQKYSDTERNSCKFGCEIKGQAEEGMDTEHKKDQSVTIQYNRWKKKYEKTFPKTSNNEIASSYKVWNPAPKYGNVFSHYERVCKNKYCNIYIPYIYPCSGCCTWWGSSYPSLCRGSRRISYKCGKSCTNVKRTKWGIVKEGKQDTIPAKWERCNWEETYEYPDKLLGKKSEEITVNKCIDFKTGDRVDEIGNDGMVTTYYRDYSIHDNVTACESGMNNYERKDCSLIASGKINCDGTKRGRYMNEDILKKAEQEKERNNYIEPTATPTVEGFSNACKKLCNKYSEGDFSTMADSTDPCYKCEVKHNPLIRNDKARDDFIDNIDYKAEDGSTGGTPVWTKLTNLFNEFTADRKILTAHNGYKSRNENAETKKKELKSAKTALNDAITSRKALEKDYKASIRRRKKLENNFYETGDFNKDEFDALEQEISNKKNVFETARAHESTSQGNYDRIKKESSSAIQEAEQVSYKQSGLLNENKKFYNKLNDMSYSGKKNATMNAFLEDMKSKTSSKNIEYGIWMGLIVVAGVTASTIINKD